METLVGGQQVRVMVVDDSAGTRAMLREALSLGGGIDVVGEAGSGREAVARATQLAPDVVLMDVRMPDGDGVEAARRISSTMPTTRIVALTWSDDPGTVREMLAAGAIGYVVKGGSIDELSGAIRRAAGGEPDLDEQVLPAVVEDLRRLVQQERDRREQIERLVRAKTEFVQVLSHELRTPLTVINGALQMLRQRGVRPEEATAIESALRRVRQLEFLVEGLELVGSDRSGEGTTDVRQALANAGRRIGASPASVASIRVEEDRWEGVPQSYVERVATELLANALRHGKPPVRVEATREGREAVLVVTDAGGWEPPPGHFSAFFQEDMSSTRTRAGFGLGLFIASRLCQACRGELTIRAADGTTVAQARFRLEG